MNSSKPVSNVVRLRDECLEDSDNLPDPDVLAQIVETSKPRSVVTLRFLNHPVDIMRPGKGGEPDL